MPPPRIIFRYTCARGDRYALEVTDTDTIHLVHRRATGTLVGRKIEIYGESDETRIEAGVDLIHELAANQPGAGESLELALEELAKCKERMSDSSKMFP